VPTYEYRCAACRHEFEEFQSMHEAALKKCPKCKKPKLERLIGSGAGILFKGGGFYQTDYRTESYKRGESSEKSDGKAPASSEAKAETAKPAESPKKAPKKKSEES
jgi:putative FmdB family regulatory protein